MVWQKSICLDCLSSDNLTFNACFCYTFSFVFIRLFWFGIWLCVAMVIKVSESCGGINFLTFSTVSFLDSVFFTSYMRLSPHCFYLHLTRDFLHCVKSRPPVLLWWEVKCAVVVTGEQMSSNKPLPQPTPGGTQKHHEDLNFKKISLKIEFCKQFGRVLVASPKTVELT